MAGGNDDKYYEYDPSLPAAVFFTIGFLLSTIVHSFQIIKTRTWLFIPFWIGSIFESIGYACRGVGATETPDWIKGPVIAQNLLLLFGPTCGGQLASADTASQRSSVERLTTGGLVVQIIFFTLFMVVTCLFHIRIRKNPTSAIKRLENTWIRLLMVLYATNFLILVRSLFRMVEFSQGSESELQTKEVYLYVLDATLMLAASVLLNVFHPSQCFSERNTGKGSRVAGQLKDYNMEYQQVGV
ncbi:hypothetical protein Cpir12675_005891 [Ceratocystis pirilliformis]|uniref:RTA1 domain protein n=1 Tax=Ceratocystis pirilliformis TaxID=259994 RepID=A0ABR3YMT1_9PEZI